MPQRRSLPWIWIALSSFILLVVGGLGLIFIAVTVMGPDVAGPRVGLIELSGVISDEGARSVFRASPSGARGFIRNVERARRDESIKAVVIRINSPGGAAAASQEMYQAVRRLKDSGKPVVCSMGDVAASGGYYVASACDKIYANGATLTGSIGVISQFLNYQELFKKVGLDSATIKSGKFKDAGNPARQLTPEERQLFQAMIMNVYGQFVSDVLAGRKGPTGGKLTKSRLLKLADGRVYTGQQAKNNLLIDALGGLREAVQDAAKKGGIEGEPKVRVIGAGGIFDALAGEETQSSGSLGARLGGEIGAAAGDAFAASLAQRLKAEAGSVDGPQLR